MLKILKINHVNGYEVFCLFNNGELRLIDFQKLFRDTFKVEEGDPAFELLNNPNAFQQIQVLELTVGWPNVGIYSKDCKGQSVFYPYDLDPLVLYQNSVVLG